MLGDPGGYKIFQRIESDHGEEERLVGRFVIQGLNLKVLEDHNGIVREIFPDGPISETILRRMQQLAHSAYWKLVSEDEVSEEDIPEIKVAPEPWVG